MSHTHFSPPKEPYLLTPGPLSTAMETKQAMLRDWGSWDKDFRDICATLQGDLLSIINDQNNEFDCVFMQGSGSFCVEAMMGSLIERDAKILVLVNGAYGKRIAQICDYLGRSYICLDKGDYLPPRGAEIAKILDDDPNISHVIAVHCETSSGILNPLQEIADVVAQRGRKLLIDAMSSFGALPIDCQTLAFDAVVSSANKCLEGVPGFGFVLARKSALENTQGNSHSLALDLHAQWQYMNKTGQWRFTPPTHTIVALARALELYHAEQGQHGRLARYSNNRDILVHGMQDLGFSTLLNGAWLSPIIVTFFTPDDKNFTFQRFYDELKARNYIIYPGKLTIADSFRMGCIGHLDATCMENLLVAIKDSLQAMNVQNASAKPADLAARDRNTADLYCEVT